MATLTLTISKLRFPSNANISNPITVILEYKEYYSDSFTVIDTGVNVDVDGAILESPLPTITIDPTLKYVIRATNELCDFQYEQTVIINPYCPAPYTVSDDGTFCFLVEETEATPPTGPENAVAVLGPNNFYYSMFGTLIFDPGYDLDGTGPFTQISYANTFWVNGAGYPTHPSLSDTDGPLNRTAVWSPTVLEPQQIGFSICVDLPETGTYYVGVACDDFGQINVDGTTIVLQDRDALKTYIQANGYPYPIGADPNQIAFNFWYVYPVEMTSGVHVIEIIGNNTSGSIAGGAAIGCEIYNLTSAEIQAATDYVGMGDGLIFSSKDYVGQPIQIGSGGVGYTCPDGYSLQTCSSPFICRRVLTTPILY
jgi:hypothetical protein